jgi:uncharacterized protein (DUF1697 family)
MHKYIAFLRAINVGGTTIIKMTDLKQMFESFGLDQVQTYIQSGNVIFESAQGNASTLEQRIERQLEETFGKRIQLFVRTMRQVVEMAAECPFDPTGDQTVHVVILRGKPSRKAVAELLSLRNEADDFAVLGKEAYNLRRDREKSIFTNNWVEKVLGVAGTTRNLTTIRKLAEKFS